MTADDITALVMKDMLPLLNNWQLTKLEESLQAVLATVMVTETTGVHEPSAKENGQLVSMFLAAKSVEGCSRRTISYYESTLVRALSTIDKHASLITTADLREYLHEYPLQHGAGNTTVDNVRRVISSFFSWLEDEDHIVKSPARRIHKIRSCIPIKKTYRDEDLEHLRDHCAKVRDLAMVDFLTSTGVRVGELVGLDRCNVDMDRRECVVLGKGNKQRVVYFDARAKVHLEAYLASRCDDSPALFVSLTRPHRRLEVSGVEERLRILGEAAGVEHVHPHKFRRTLATRAIDKGMPIEQVQRLLGHQKIDTTMIYAMVDQNNVRASHQRYIC